MDLLLFILLPVAPFVAIYTVRHWRPTVLFIMIFMVFEGALRKWVLPGLQTQIYLIKDGLLLLAFSGFCLERRLKGPHLPLMRSVHVATLLGMAYCLLELANTNSPSPLIWLIGFKSYFLYVALMFMAPYIFSSVSDFEQKMKIYMILMIPVALLGLVQFALPPDHFLNTYVVHDVDVGVSISTFGDAANSVRTSSTFSYIGGFGTFIPAMIGLTLVYVLARQRSDGYLVAIALLACCCLAVFTTGSRGVIVNIGLASFIGLMLAASQRLISSTVLFRIVLAVVVIGTVASYFAEQAINAFAYRADNSDDPIKRLFSPFAEALNAFENGPIFGTGLGTTHNSAATVMGTKYFYWLHGVDVETETSRVMLEIGIVGFLLIYAPRIVLVFVAMDMMRRLKRPLFKAYCAIFAGYALAQIFGFVINNPTGGLYYWFGAGLMFAMYRLEHLKAPADARRAAPQPAVLLPYAPRRF